MIATVVGIAVGSFYGLKGVATGYTISSFLLFIPQLFYCFYKTPIKVTGFLKNIASPAATTLVGGVIFYLMINSLNVDTRLMHALYAVIFIIIMSLLTFPRKIIRETIMVAISSFKPHVKEKDMPVRMEKVK